MVKLVTGNVFGGELLEKIRELAAVAKAQDPQLKQGKVVDLALVPKEGNLEVTLLFQA
jgi:hypothetical protein